LKKSTDRLNFEPIENVVYFHESRLKGLERSRDLLDEKVEILFDSMTKILKMFKVGF